MLRHHMSRRHWLQSAAASGATGCLSSGLLVGGLRPVSAVEGRLEAGDVRFSDDIEPLVRFLEETPREQIIERVAERLQDGSWSYREMVAGLFLAAIRNVQPRPSVGFKFHAVLVVYSAHLASINSSAEDRWLPILWAIDEFKSSQARDVQEGNWTMAAVDEARVPSATRAVAAFREAMDRWDEDGADVAAAGLARHASREEAFECFAEYAARDFRSIGHKVIYVANAFRTLDLIGWRFAEPILRSLAYAMLNHVGEPNPAESDLGPDRPWRENKTLAEAMAGDWMVGAADSGRVLDLVDAFRSLPVAEAGARMSQSLGEGLSLQGARDALWLGASELMMRQPGIVSLHSLTTTNAVQYLVRSTRSDTLRRRLVLQNASFLTQFLEAMRGRGAVNDHRVTEVEAAPELPQSASELFVTLGSNPMLAAGQMKRVVDANPRQISGVMKEARRLIFLKGSDSHDYKYSSAILEDVEYLSPEYRSLYMAGAVFKLRPATEATRPLVERIRAALG